jgi:hypothetical protein
MERDHWIEIVRLAGRATGQPRLHNVKKHRTASGAFAPSHGSEFCSLISVVPTLAMMACRAEAARTYAQPVFALARFDAAASAAAQRRLVEPIGIEPTTSSLQSSRSPN